MEFDTRCAANNYSLIWPNKTAGRKLFNFIRIQINKIL